MVFAILRRMIQIVALTLVVVGQASAPPQAQKATAKPADFKKQIAPFMQKFCIACHSGARPADGIDFSVYKTQADVDKNTRPLRKAGREVEGGEMPPRNAKNQPTDAQRTMFANWAKSLKK